MNQVVQTHLIISKIDVNRIIQTCDSLVNNQNITVNQLISLFCKISGYDSYCQQIVSLCNQILSYTVTSSNDIVNVCKSLKACEVNSLSQNNVSSSILKQPVASRQPQKRSKRSLLKSPIATNNPDLPAVTRNPLLPIETSKSELSIVSRNLKFQLPSSEGKIQTATSVLKSPSANSKTDLFITNNKSEIYIAPNECEPPDFPESTSSPKCTVVTRNPELSEFPIVTNTPELVTTNTELPIHVETSLNQNSNTSSIPKKPEPTLKKSVRTETFQAVDDLNLSALEGEGQVVVIIEGDETMEFNDVTNLCDDLTMPMNKSNTIATSKSRLYIKNKPNVTMVTSKPQLFISTSKSKFNDTDKPELTIATELSIATSPDQNNTKSSTMAPPMLYNSTDIEKAVAIDDILQNNGVHADVAHSFQTSKQNKKLTKKPYRFKCSLCPKAFERNKYLIRHTNFHASREAMLTYICEICGKILKKRDRVKEHKRIHLNHKPVGCPHCDYRCVSKRYLAIHMVKHSGEKRQQCAQCGKCFMHLRTLRFHELSHNVPE
ncbi:hypothetical protein SNE40_017193 [Patella caerulea]|uniref:C2H2-type domain-containing protein n=1 Tax=Patella caerulea TaxID=87958 RepID=A0AAN8JD99_PATCE